MKAARVLLAALALLLIVTCASAEPSRKILDAASTAAEVSSDASQVASDASKVAGDVSQAIKGIFWDATSELGGCLKGLPCGAPGALGCCDGWCCTDLLCLEC